jgi:hypothetical protein
VTEEREPETVELAAVITLDLNQEASAVRTATMSSSLESGLQTDG